MYVSGKSEGASSTRYMSRAFQCNQGRWDAYLLIGW